MPIERLDFFINLYISFCKIDKLVIRVKEEFEIFCIFHFTLCECHIFSKN